MLRQRLPLTFELFTSNQVNCLCKTIRIPFIVTIITRTIINNIIKAVRTIKCYIMFFIMLVLMLQGPIHVWAGSCREAQLCCIGRDSSCVVQKAPINAIIENINDKPCYCDHACLKLGDCCTDFKDHCGVLDCRVGDWGEWSECNVSCGMGIMARTRNIIQMPQNGGKRCPTLMQKRGCQGFRCHGHRERKILREMALLLPAALASSKRHINNSQANLQRYRDAYEHNRQLVYCVEFEVLKASKACHKLPSYNIMIEGDRIAVRCDLEAYIYENDNYNSNNNNNNNNEYNIYNQNNAFNNEMQGNSQLTINELSNNYSLQNDNNKQSNFNNNYNNNNHKNYNNNNDNNEWNENSDNNKNNNNKEVANNNDDMNVHNDYDIDDNDDDDDGEEEVKQAKEQRDEHVNDNAANNEDRQNDHYNYNYNNNDYYNYYNGIKRTKYYNKKVPARTTNTSKSKAVTTTTTATETEIKITSSRNNSSTSNSSTTTTIAKAISETEAAAVKETQQQHHCRGEGLPGRTTRWNALAAPSCHGKWLRLTVGVPKPCKQEQFIFV